MKQTNRMVVVTWFTLLTVGCSPGLVMFDNDQPTPPIAEAPEIQVVSGKMMALTSVDGQALQLVNCLTEQGREACAEYPNTMACSQLLIEVQDDGNINYECVNSDGQVVIGGLVTGKSGVTSGLPVHCGRPASSDCVFCKDVFENVVLSTCADVTVIDDVTSEVASPTDRRWTDVPLRLQATCGLGEMDLVWQVLEQADPTQPAPPLVVSIETEDKTLLGSLDIADLVPRITTSANAPPRPFLDVLADTGTLLDLGVELSQTNHDPTAGPVEVSVRVCIDQNGDGACFDEADNVLQGLTGEVAENFDGAPALLAERQAELGLNEDGEWELTEIEAVLPQEVDQFPNQGTIAFTLNYQSDEICTAEEESAAALLAAQRRNRDCFVPNTQIQVSATEALPIEEVIDAPTVMTHNGEVVRAIHTSVRTGSHSVVALITTAGHHLTVTRDHPIVTDHGVKIAGHVLLSDRLMTHTGGFAKLQSLKRFTHQGAVYNLALPGSGLDNHLLVAEGLVTGDLTLQALLADQ